MDNNKGDLKNLLTEALDNQVSDQFYLDTENVTSWLTEHDYNFNVLHINVHSLLGKQHHIRDMLDSIESEEKHIHAIYVCETHLNPVTQDGIDLTGFTYVGRNRKNKNGGGVGIFIRKEFNFKTIDTYYNEEIFEAITIEVKLGKRDKLIISEFYRAPNSNCKNFLEKYKEYLMQLTKNEKVIVCYDSNLTLLKMDKHNPTSDFFNINLESGMIPSILIPTRVTHSSATLIDNINVSQKLLERYESTVIETDLSDHYPCIIKLKMNEIASPVSYYEHDMCARNLTQVVQAISKTNFNNITNTSNLEHDVDVFTKVFQSNIDTFCPLTKRTIKSHKTYRSPWITDSIVKSSRKCEKLYRKMNSKDKNSSEYLEYMEYKCVLNKVKRTAKRLHLSRIITTGNRNSCAIWTAINIALNRKKNKNNISSEFRIKGKITGDLKLITNEFCDFYANVGKKT